jgi:hypothetical protein
VPRGGRVMMRIGCEFVSMAFNPCIAEFRVQFVFAPLFS